LNESSVSIDAGVKYQPAKFFNARAFGYSRWTDNLIGCRRASIGYVVPYNTQSTRTIGLEIELFAHLFSFLDLSQSLNLMDARDTSPNRQLTNDILPYRPRFVSTSEATLSFEDVWLKPSVSAIFRYQSDRFADPAGLIVLPAQSSLDLQGELRFFPSVVRIRLTNLLNQAQSDVIGYPLPLRAIHASWEVTW
jgi:outer membrane cobalamin receptor